MYVVEEKLQDEDQCHIAGDDIGGIQCILYIGNLSVLCLIEVQTIFKLRKFFCPVASLRICTTVLFWVSGVIDQKY